MASPSLFAAAAATRPPAAREQADSIRREPAFHRIREAIRLESCTYQAIAKDAGIYRGRGTTDGKGPSLAALYGARLAKEMGYPV
ncbi:MAG TPA: hypothetical protein VFF61_00670, partial [Microvirga sp.]|nr:hypothetical protein [Microvirga sp.]